MSQLKYQHQSSKTLAGSWIRWAAHRQAAHASPKHSRPVVFPLVSRILTWAAVVAGIGAQLLLLWLAGELVDLYVSAVELWAELARKHLELTS